MYSTREEERMYQDTETVFYRGRGGTAATSRSCSTMVQCREGMPTRWVWCAL
jgi:hypothetical protein